MRPTNIAFLSRTLGWCATLAAFIVPLTTLIVFLSPGHDLLGGDYLQLALRKAPLAYRLAALPFALIANAFTVWALWSLRKLMFHYARGEVFTFAPLRALNHMAVGLFASVIMGFVMNIPISLLLSWHQGPGHREITMQFSSRDVADLVIAGVVLVIARVMAEAQRLADENAKFV